MTKYGDSVTDKKLLAIICALFALLIPLQLTVGWRLMVEPSWDFGGVYTSALEYLSHGRVVTHEHYFERFQNNSGILLLEIAYFYLIRLLGFTPGIGWGIYLNVAFIDLSILFALLFCKKVWGNRRTAIFALMCPAFTPFILYAPIFYTDTLSMPFITLSLYLFALSGDAKNKYIKLLLWFSCGLSAGIASVIKGSAAIFLVAAVFYSIFNFGIKKLAAFLLAVLIPFFSVSAGVDMKIRDMGIIKEENEERFQFPTEYWIYMGLRSPGGFNNEDFNYIYGLESRTERKEAASAGISERIKEHGFLGTLGHLAKKSSYIYYDGGYLIGSQLAREPMTEGRLRNIFSGWSENYKYYLSVTDAFHYVMLAFVAVSLIFRLKSGKFDFLTLLQMSILGLSLFLLIWEARSRYLFNFTPLFLLAAADGLDNLREWLKAKIPARHTSARNVNFH